MPDTESKLDQIDEALEGDREQEEQLGERIERAKREHTKEPLPDHTHGGGVI